MPMTPTEAIANTPNAVTLGSREYAVSQPPRRVARELRKRLAGLLRMTAQVSNDNPTVAADMLENIDEFVDVLQLIPVFGSDWKYINENATDEQMMTALMEVMRLVMSPLSKIGASLATPSR